MASSRRSAAKAVARDATADVANLASHDAVQRSLRSRLLIPQLAQATIGIAWSGGLDSTVLLHACVALLGADRVTAFHVHHDLQAAADEFVAHCEKVALALNVRLQVLRLTRPASSRDGLEAWARAQRYRAIADAACQQDVAMTLTAHHRDDQAETVLHRLMRGSGAAGMSAIQPLIKLQGHTFVRPLLAVPRSALLAYASHHRLSWIDDPSNQQQQFTRNAIRQRVLPVIDAISPGVAARIARAAAHWQDANEVLNGYLDAELARLVTALMNEPGASLSVLNTAALTQMPASRAQLVMRRWLEGSGVRAPDQARSEQITRQCLAANTRYAQIDHEGLTLLRYRQKVFAVPRGRAMIERLAQAHLQLTWSWRRDAVLSLPAPYPIVRLRRVTQGLGLDAGWFDRADLTLIGRVATSMKFQHVGAKHPRPLKDLLQSAAVPQWLRPLVFALLRNDELVAVAGLGGSATLPWTDTGERWTVMLDWSDVTEGSTQLEMSQQREVQREVQREAQREVLRRPECILAAHILGDSLLAPGAAFAKRQSRD